MDILLPQQIAEDGEQNEDKIRPQKLADYIGQKDLKGVLKHCDRSGETTPRSLRSYPIIWSPRTG